MIDAILKKYLEEKGMHKQASDSKYISNLKKYLLEEEAFYVDKKNI